MSIQVFGDLKTDTVLLNLNNVTNAVALEIPLYSSAPTGITGSIYYDTTQTTLFLNNGTTYVAINGTGPTGIFLDNITWYESPTDPNTGPTGVLVEFNQYMANKAFMQNINENGLSTIYAPSQISATTLVWYPSTGATIGIYNSPPISTAGTITTSSVATTSIQSQRLHIIATSAATNSSSANIRSTAQYYRASNGIGGFFFYCRFSTSTAGAQQRLFIGFLNSAAAPSSTAEPSTFTNSIGISYDSTATTLSATSNNNSTTTTTSLGANFPVDNSTVYDFFMYCPGNGAGATSNSYYQVDNVNTGASTSGTYLEANLPAINGAATLLSPQLFIGNGTPAGGAAAVLLIYIVYIESPN